nr:MAG TPA: hypothetical protein [Caudoviricetes sp.]
MFACRKINKSFWLVRLGLAWHRVDRFVWARLAWHGNVWFGTARRCWVRLARLAEARPVMLRNGKAGQVR